ncbi:DedA family protein [Neobacillus sp. LXY-4]|uniref:DedA family protein n=1 Tax=Neobacillus sp. LXY-4 TaxID=3379826 RepID=UPI003EE3F5B8
METDFILEIIKDYGYIGLFFWLWLGIFGIPVPNEVIVMSIGFLSYEKVLHPVATFIVTYSGIVAALTTCYSLGRFVGRPFLHFFEKRKRFSRKIDSSFRLIERYHAFSLSLSYFLPGFRNFVPFLYGVSKYSFRSFMIFSYGGALVWLSIVFSIGYWFNGNIKTILVFGNEFLFGLATVVIFVIIFKLIHRKRIKKMETIKGHGPNL